MNTCSITRRCLSLTPVVGKSGKFSSVAEWRRRKDRKFIDWKKVKMCGGKGGDGCVSFKQATSTKVQVGGPDGGDGGNGGSIGFVVDTSLHSLRSLRTLYKARDGKGGQGSYHTGRSGKDVEIKVPMGTLIREHPSKEILHDLLLPNSSCIVAQGGEGGMGNAIFSSTVNRKPIDCTPGDPGEETIVEVELRVIADVGLVGLPNVGKSTLLRALSHATPKVAAYPFTTLNPQVGVVENEEGVEEEGRVTVADIPGLMTDAHLNRGLGHAFLRHVKRCHLLLYVLDASNMHIKMAAQLHILRQELEHYDQELLRNCRLVVANKMDTHCKDGDNRGDSGLSTEFIEEVQRLRESFSLPVMPISALLLWNIVPLKRTLFRMCNS